ncbi:hypothetical protein D3C87_1556610 [compost metagenome]
MPIEVKEETIYTVTAINIGGNSVFQISLLVSPALGIEDPVLNKVKIYPNPVKDILNIDGENEIQRLEIYNLLGQLVHSEQYDDSGFGTESVKLVDFSELKSGMYILILFVDNERLSYKILKK